MLFTDTQAASSLDEFGFGRSTGFSGTNPFATRGRAWTPTDVKYLFAACRYYFLTNPLINAAVTKMAMYPITEVLFNAEDPKIRAVYEQLFDQLEYHTFLIEMGLDYNTFGNALCMLYFPFIKYLHCKNPTCKQSTPIDQANYSYSGHEFTLKCKCGWYGTAEASDVYVRTSAGIKLIRLNPENFVIHYNEANGERTYQWYIPDQLRFDVLAGRKNIIRGLPQEYLEAIRKNKPLYFNPKRIYHMKRPSITAKTLGRSWGVPMLLPVLEDVFFLQVLRKAQECVSPNTLIETQAGFVRADTVQIGDLVRTHTGLWYPVEDKWSREARADEVGVCITPTGLRPLPSTFSPQHPILTIQRNADGRRSDTKEKQRSSVILRNPQLYEEFICPAEQLEVGDYVLYPRYLPASEQMVDVACYTGLSRTDNMVPGVAKTKRTPQEVMSGTDEVKIAYLKGLWEADGYISERNATLVTVSRELAYDVYRLLLHLGCIATVSTHHTQGSTLKDGRTIKASDAFRVCVSARSRDRLCALWSGVEAPEVVSGKSGFFWKTYFAARICSVERVQEEQYIDFKIAHDTTFCTPGIATKNSIASEHLVPLRVLYPQGTAGADAPFSVMNLSEWKDQIHSEVQKWRKDRNYIPVLPVPVGNQTIAGDGRALVLHQEIRVTAEHICAGMGTPVEFVFGGLSYSGSSVSTRMLENVMLNYRQAHIRLINWTIRSLASYMHYPLVEGSLKDFRMADDLNRRQYLFNLWQSKIFSREDLLEESGIDASDQEMKVLRDEQYMARVTRIGQEAQMDLQLEQMRKQNDEQLRVQQQQQQMQQQQMQEQQQQQMQQQGQEQQAPQEAQPNQQGAGPEGVPTDQQAMQEGGVEGQATDQYGQPIPTDQQGGGSAVGVAPQGMGSPLGTQQAGGVGANEQQGVQLGAVVQNMAARLIALPPEQRITELSRIRRLDPLLAEEVVSALSSLSRTQR